jgi:Immunity protein Imm1
MQVADLQGCTSVSTEEELLDRLRTIRKGNYGAFILSHNDDGPFLYVHIHSGFAYVHYFDDMSGANAGYQPTDMTPHGCPQSIRFVQIDGSESSGCAIEVPEAAFCSLDAAYSAAVEFLHSSKLPQCITWLAL